MHSMTGSTGIDALVSLIEGARIDLSTEAAAQRGLHELLTRDGLEFEAEVSLAPGDRIDFLVRDLGLEVKIGSSRRQILRQLERYAASPRIVGLILVTATPFPSRRFVIAGKPARVASLSRGWL